MADFPSLDLDSALSLMNSAPATAGTSEWVPDDGPRAELPEEEAAAPETTEGAEPAAAETTEDTKDTPDPEGQGETTDETPDPVVALPTIEPPSAWKTEEKEVWESLPRKAQEAILRREQDRTTELRNLQNATAEQRKQVESEVSRLQGLAAQIAGTVDDRIADLVREFPNIKTQADVEALAASDPARFSVFQAKLMRFNSAQATAQEAQRELNARQEQQQSEFLQAARQRLLDALPAWKDETVRKKEMTELQDYAISQGAPEQDARMALDPVVYKLAQKAMLYDRAQAAKTQAINRDPPKVIKPGTGTTKVEQRADARTAQLRKLEKSGDLEDALALMRG